LRQALLAFFTSAVSVPHYSIGCLLNATVANLFCGLMTPMKSVIWKPLWNQFSKVLSGLELLGMRARVLGAIVDRIFNLNAPNDTQLQPNNFLTLASPTETLQPLKSSMLNARRRKLPAVLFSTAEDLLPLIKKRLPRLKQKDVEQSSD
jgi:hypothetical protein